MAPITSSCGEDPVTIEMLQTGEGREHRLVTVIDGGGLVTLAGRASVGSSTEHLRPEAGLDDVTTARTQKDRSGS